MTAAISFSVDTTINELQFSSSTSYTFTNNNRTLTINGAGITVLGGSSAPTINTNSGVTTTTDDQTADQQGRLVKLTDLSGTQQSAFSATTTPTSGLTTALVVSVVLTLLVQSLGSFVSMAVPVLAPAIATDRGLDPALIGFYPAIMYSAGLIVLLQSARLFGWFGPMKLSVATAKIA